MAANTSFKQQCPSCEENVLIKDGKLVGKKVDCPKCKFRFVVEEPKEESADYEEVGDEEEKPAPKKAAAKPGSKANVKVDAKPGSKASVKVDPKKDANGKGPATKKDANGKPAPAIKKKPKKDDDDDDEKPTFKKKSDKAGSKKIVMVVGIAVVAISLLGVAGYFVFGGGDTTKPRRGTGIGAANTGKGDTGEEGGTKTETPIATAPKPELADPSNHLVAGADLVVNIRPKEVANSPIGRILFDPAGGFSAEETKKELGFGADEVDRLLVTYSFKSDWLFMVIRTSSATNLTALKASGKLKSGGAPIKGQEYFITPESWRKSDAADKNPGARPMAFRLHDAFTLVVGDLEPMKEFLEAEGKPRVQEGGVMGNVAPPPPPPPPPGMTPAPGGAPVKEARPFSTTSPRLRSILDRFEDKPTVLMSMAIDVAASSKELTRKAPNAYLVTTVANLAVENAGCSLNSEHGYSASLVLESKSAENAKKMEAFIQQFMVLGKTMFESEGFVVDWKQPDPSRPAFPGPAPVVKPDTPAEKKDEDPQSLHATLEGPKLNDRFVQCSARLSPAAFMTLNLKYLVPPIQQMKGEAELAQKQPTPHDLSTAARKLATQNKGYPRGAFERPLTPQRGGRPYLANERVSWMAELLPHLGYAEVHRTIEFQHSWADDKNLGPALSLIPYFVDPAYPPSSRHVLHPRRDVPAATTHFVGIAGIGLDAGSYLAGDPAAEGKLGVFGYDRTTPLADVGGNTIIMVQIPPPPVGQVGPWLAGGGATIRGVPEKNSVAPFVPATTFNGKRGTYALMSDGSVRFIAADVSDEVFKALAVVKKDKEVLLDTVPKVDKKTELKATELPKP